ncbi:MAG TPA: terminase small subunit [Mobilitalea sp.]|nr:terminase small subunit [Mobilitalea sp.]
MANSDFKNPIKSSPEELRKSMQKLKVIYDWPKINLDSDTEVEERISLYFNYSMQQGLRPTIEGLALSIGISRNSLWEWETGRSRATSSNSRGDIIKKAKDYIAFLMSNEVMNGNINPVTWIFYAKNYFGMVDKQEINVSANNQLAPTMDLEQIAEKVKSDVVIDADWKEE